MTTAAEYRVWSFDDFCDRIPEGMKADLIDGVIYVASPDNIQHFRINSWLHEIQKAYLRKRKIKGEIFGYRLAFRLGEKNGPEPDLAYVSPERADQIQGGHIDGPPDWIVEIVSPDSVERDYRKKRKLYQRFGVAEYWIIDPLEEAMTCFRLGKNGKYKQIRPYDAKIISHVIPGFWLKPTWFWQSPLPDEDETLREILKPANGNS